MLAGILVVPECSITCLQSGACTLTRDTLFEFMCSTCSFKFLEGILGSCHRLYFKILIPSGFFTSPRRTSLILGYAASARWGNKAPFWGFVCILLVTSASCQTTWTVQPRLPQLRKKARTISSTVFAQSVPVWPVCPSLSFVPLSNRKERNNPTDSLLHFFPSAL